MLKYIVNDSTTLDVWTFSKYDEAKAFAEGLLRPFEDKEVVISVLDGSNGYTVTRYHVKRVMKRYRYGMRLRGFSPGCQPMDGLLGREEDTSRKYWDILVYDRELTEQEVRDYELEELR